MHRLRNHENEHAPCNALCDGDIHADLVFIAPAMVEGLVVPLLVYAKEVWQCKGQHRESELLSIKPVGEAADVANYYPRTYRNRPMATEPYLVRYRLHKVAK